MATTIPKGLNEQDLALVQAVMEELEAAQDAPTMRSGMEKLLFARHLLDTLLRKMQDD